MLIRKGAIKMKNIIRGVVKHALNDEYGWFYERYDEETEEGYGYFGKEGEPEYYFEYSLMYDEECGCERLMERHCGIGTGCFWTDWQ